MKRIVSILLLFWVVAAPVSSFAESGLFGDEHEKAERLYAQKRYDLALIYYKKLLVDKPENEDYLFKAGFCFLQIRQFEQAISTFSKLLSINDSHTDAILQLAYTLKILQRHQDAESWYHKLSKFMPRTGEHLAAGCEFAYSDFNLPTHFNVAFSPMNSDHADFFINYLNGRLLGASTEVPINVENLSKSGPANHVEGENSLYWLNTTDQSKRFLRASFEYSRNVGPIGFARNSGLIAYSKNKFTEGVRQVAQASYNMSLHFAYLNEDNIWVEHTGFPYNSEEYSIGYPYLTADGETLYFASDMPGGYGGFDIYVSYFIDSIWTSPQNLGPRINTPGDEISPFFDGLHIYFSSDWHHGYGGLDIFRADFNYESWTDPINLGPMVNSSFDDFNFVFFESLGKGFFCSDRPAKFDNENIYEVTKKSKFISVKVSDLKSGLSIKGAEVDLSRCGFPVGITDENGEFTFEIHEGFDCYISIMKVGFTNTSFRVKHKDIPGPTKKYSIKLNETGNFFTGTILADSSNMPVKGVYISIVNELDGELQETYTDHDGRYALHIKPRGRYHISFAKTGYLPFHLDFRTENKVNKDVLGTIRFKKADNLLIGDFYRQDVFSESDLSVKDLKPDLATALASSQFVDVEPKRVMPTDPIESSNVSLEPVSVESPVEIKKEKPSKNFDKKVAEKRVNEAPPAAIKISDYLPNENRPEIAGYVIQVAAMNRKNVDITPFKYYLSKFGDIYVSRRDDDLLRIMVGVFDDKITAEENLIQIRSEKFNEAFITPLPTGVKLEPIEDFAKKANASNSSVRPVAINASAEEYMVNLGQFKNMLWFDNRAVEALGLIEERKEGGKVVILLSGYRSKDEAAEALAKVKKLGYQSAQLVKNGKDGKLIPVK